MASARRCTPETVDPRILRTRRMLSDALGRLLNQKAFGDISVQEIADEAALNRGTFYLHYLDKGALLQAMTETRFRDLLDRRGIVFTSCDDALRAIALGVCDYLSETTGCPTQLAQLPLEGTIIPVVEAMFQQGLAAHGRPPGVESSLVATTVAWAIFGAARGWFQTPNRIPAEQMAARIESVVKPLFTLPG